MKEKGLREFNSEFCPIQSHWGFCSWSQQNFSSTVLYVLKKEDLNTNVLNFSLLPKSSPSLCLQLFHCYCSEGRGYKVSFFLLPLFRKISLFVWLFHCDITLPFIVLQNNNNNDNNKQIQNMMSSMICLDFWGSVTLGCSEPRYCALSILESTWTGTVPFPYMKHPLPLVMWEQIDLCVK